MPEARSFFRRLITYTSWLHRVFFLRFRIRGLGYRFRRITPFLFRFFFTRTNYIYFHRPATVHLFFRKRRIILLSDHKEQLHTVFSHILRLHRAGPYNRRGFMFPRRVFRRKPGKKVI